MRSTANQGNPLRRAMVFAPAAIGAIYLFGRTVEPKPEFNVKEVLLEEARVLIAAGALVVDVRERAAYETRHIAGAVLAPVASLAKAIPSSLAAARTLPIVVYCGDGATLGPKGTHLLNTAGFTGAVNLKPGIQGWASAGFPIERGPGKLA